MRYKGLFSFLFGARGDARKNQCKQSVAMALISEQWHYVRHRFWLKILKSKTYERINIMNISLISSIDKSSKRLRWKIIPLAIDSLKNTFFIDYAARDTVVSKLRGRGYISSDENVVMSISFDPKSCGMPFSYCPEGCCDRCYHNPLNGLLDPWLSDGPFVITRKDTINLLLDVIDLLAKANTNALLLEKGAVEELTGE